MPLGEKTKLLWQNPEYRRMMSLRHMGKKQSTETIAKRVLKLIGRKMPPMSDETRRKIGEASSRIIRSEASNKKRRLKLLGNKNCLGVRQSEETKKKHREYRHTEEAILKIKMASIKRGQPRVNYQNTSIERKIKRELELRQIEFRQNVPIEGIANVDFLLPKENIIIECDGDYWHNLPGVPERDAFKTKKLKEVGYEVFRFWEHEINKSPSACIDRLSTSK